MRSVLGTNTFWVRKAAELGLEEEFGLWCGHKKFSADHMGNSEAGPSELFQTGVTEWAFLLVHQSVIGCRLPSCKKGA